MYKIASIGLLGLIAILVIPAGTQSMTNDGLGLFGQATMTYNDISGNEMLTQTVHNQLYDQGETFILEQTFTNGTAHTADNISIGAICISTAEEIADETDDHIEFNVDHAVIATGGENNCETDDEVTFAAQIATIGPLQFQADTGDDNLATGQTIKTIGICAAEVSDADIAGCQSILFAVVNTSDVTLASGETVDITYTFNMASAGT